MVRHPHRLVVFDADVPLAAPYSLLDDLFIMLPPEQARNQGLVLIGRVCYPISRPC